MKELKKEDVKNLAEIFPGSQRSVMEESLGTWFNASKMDTEKMIEKAQEMIEKIKNWAQNWELILTEQKKKKAARAGRRIFSYT